jgi:hypothetical protein
MRGEEESTRTFVGQEALLAGQFGFLDIFKVRRHSQRLFQPPPEQRSISNSALQV